MFSTKQKTLLEGGTTVPKAKDHPFIDAGLKSASKTVSGNGAEKFDKTSNEFVTQFGSVGMYKTARKFEDISKDMIVLWDKNPGLALCFVFYLRIITRIVSLFDGLKTKSVQRGAGLKHEAIMRMVWVHINYPDVFWKNINLFIAVGSWNDIIKMLSYDLQFNGWAKRTLDWDKFGQLLLAGLENKNQVNLVKKYLPQIKPNGKCKTLESQADNLIAKWICSLLFGNKGEQSGWTYKQYRLLKTSGTAHQWQQLISKGQFLKINFDSVHGRALAQLVSSEFLKRNGLELKYKEWIANKPVAKFTGYVYELAAMINNGLQKYQEDTINAQYRQLLEVAGKTNTNMIVVKDTSGSMDHIAFGTKQSSYNVAKAMSIFLGNMITGWFNNTYIDFSSKATLRKIKGKNFVEHWKTEDRLQSADTNFLAVANLLCTIKNQGVHESDFPNGAIFISDGEFNRVNMYGGTNIEAFKKILATTFSKDFIKDFKFCFWDIHNTFYGSARKTKFETFNMENNVFYFSGFDPSVVTFLTGVEGKSGKLPSTADELFEAAMDQEVLNMIEI